MKILLLISVFFYFTSPLLSQRILTLEEAISISLKESYDIRSARYSLTGSEKNLEALKLGLMSSVDLEFDLPRYSRSLTSQFNPSVGNEEFFTVGNTTLEGRLAINQPLIFSDGTLSLISSLFGREQYSELAGTTKDFYSDFRLQLRQPLFAFNNQQANMERAEINLDKTKRRYTSSERQIIYEVTAGFFNLFKARKNSEITREKVSQTEISYNTAANKFKAGLIAEVEALQLEVDLAVSRNELLNADRSFEEAKNDFKILIGLDIGEIIDVSAEIDYIPIETDIETAIGYALRNRPELLDAEADVVLSGLDVEEVDSRTSIKAELLANYGINRNNEKFVNIFNNFEDNRSVIFTVSVPVWDWGKNGREVEAAEAIMKRRELELDNLNKTIVKEIISAVNKLNSAKARVEVLSKSVEVAVKSYDISLERFKAGTITSFELAQMQLRVTDAKTNSLNALIDYKLALADLELKTYHRYDTRG